MINLTTVNEFRPISLCSVLYKIVAKSLSNGLKLVLPSVIHNSLSAFVPNRNILDSVMMGFETMHTVKHLKKGKRKAMALKLDMAKAYDRVEWCYLEALMLWLGFASSWVAKIMNSITTVSFSVLWQGSPFGHFMPERGL